jgi:DtxR family Mn-dependent transcriptional regulator
MNLEYDTTTQEYVKVIYALEQENRVARVTDIAERRGVTKSSVSLVLTQLQKKQLVDRKQYSHITLTKAGRRLGSELQKRHQAITIFLTEILGVPLKIAEEDACKIEHDLSLQTWQELRRFVTVITECPHSAKERVRLFSRCKKFASGDLECDLCLDYESEKHDAG